jgi:hypothetical protein
LATAFAAPRSVGVGRQKILELQANVARRIKIERTNGVRNTVPAIRSRAASISAKVMGLTGSSMSLPNGLPPGEISSKGRR